VAGFEYTVPATLVALSRYSASVSFDLAVSEYDVEVLPETFTHVFESTVRLCHWYFSLPPDAEAENFTDFPVGTHTAWGCFVTLGLLTPVGQATFAVAELVLDVDE